MNSEILFTLPLAFNLTHTTPSPIPSFIEIFRLNVLELRVPRGPAQAVGSCSTGPPAGWKMPITLDKIWRMMGWDTVHLTKKCPL